MTSLPCVRKFFYCRVLYFSIYNNSYCTYILLRTNPFSDNTVPSLCRVLLMTINVIQCHMGSNAVVVTHKIQVAAYIIIEITGKPICYILLTHLGGHFLHHKGNSLSFFHGNFQSYCSTKLTYFFPPTVYYLSLSVLEKQCLPLAINVTLSNPRLTMKFNS